MFCDCSSLIKLHDISNLNTKNVRDMSFIFYNCSLINKLPDISKWNIENLIDAGHVPELFIFNFIT